MSWATVSLCVQQWHCSVTGLIPAVRQQFPATRHRGCFFHHSQAIWKNVQLLGLQGAYNTDPAVRRQDNWPELRPIQFLQRILYANTEKNILTSKRSVEMTQTCVNMNYSKSDMYVFDCSYVTSVTNNRAYIVFSVHKMVTYLQNWQ